MSVIIETSIGDFTIDLFIDERPKCCKNFLKLCKVKYYNFCLFHSVQRNFIAQTGDPTGTGKGGESIHGTLYGDQARYFDWEFVPKIKHVKPGLVSMVNNGHNMHGSQFFITLGNSLDYLDGVHTVFGEVTEGLEVITKLNEAYCDEKFRPFRDIRIHHTIILEDPFDDPPGLDMPDRSPSPTPEVIERARLAADAEIDEFEGLTEEEIREIMEEREEKSNAQILEMIGDLPSADVIAPENVLFVCKLNSVTTDEDLEIIFSRFGTIKSCEVIRDHKTGESLQYAFIEFERQEDCESAYFKMDNVLIDDRRIHVDFSQSVSKIKWKGKGKGVETINDEPKKPKYIIKDKSQRQDNNYDLVFGDDDDNKSSKKRHKERSHNKEDNYRHKKRQNHSRSRSPVDARKRQRSPERERKNDRRRDEREDRYSSSPKNRGLRKSSSPRYRNERHMSPPRTRDKRYMSPPRHGGSSSVSRNRDDKYSDFKNKDKSPSRKEERRQEKRNYRSDSEETRGKERLKNKKRRSISSEDDKSSERKKRSLRHTEISDSEEDMRSRKKNKHADMSDEEKEKTKKMKKKKKSDSSDENEDVDDEKRKKKKKKKHQSISEDESTADDKHESRKRKKGDSNERQIYKNRNSESPPGRKSDKHNSVNYKNSSREEKTKYRDNDRDEYKYRR